MSEIEERFISTPQQELEYQKRKNSELLSYAEKNHKLIEELMARAEKAEAEVDELKRKLSGSEAEVKTLHDLVDYWYRKCQLQESRLEQEVDKLKRQKTLANPADWERVRIDAAIAIMQSLLPDMRAGDESLFEGEL